MQRGGEADDLTVHADDDGTILVDVGSRFVAVGDEELERIFDRIAADGGGVRLLGGGGRAEDGDEAPDRESEPGVIAAGYVLALAQARGMRVIREA